MADNKKVTINEKFCFSDVQKDAKVEHNACRYFLNNREKFEQDKILFDSKVPIVFDTNIILKLYNISFCSRDELIRFINTNAARIYIPAQVMEEYLRHRVSTIDSSIRSISELSKEFKESYKELENGLSKCVNKMNAFCDRQIIKQDLNTISKSITTWIEETKNAIKPRTDELSAINTTIDEGVKEIKKKAGSNFEDVVLEAITKTNVLPTLSEEEKVFLRNLYSQLKEQRDKLKETIKDYHTFPGSGDHKKAVEGYDPCGDFYIYHEMLKLMKGKDCDVVFFTDDVTKRDWVKPSKVPFSHYLIDEYANTGHMIDILDMSMIPINLTPIVPDVDAHEGEILNTTDIESEDGKVAEKEIKEATAQVVSNIDQDEYGYCKKKIDPERFINELRTSLLWATTYGDGYVSEEFFLRNILGGKRFNYEVSRTVLSSLIKDNVVASNAERHDDREIKCLTLVENTQEI